MKRFLVLLVLLAGGLAAAALSIPSNAAVVNGTTISQQTLNSDVSAIAGSAYYQCYLNSQAALQQQQIPPVVGAGKGQGGQNATATTAFTATYLDTEVGHQLIYQVADQRGVTVTSSQLARPPSRYHSLVVLRMRKRVAVAAYGLIEGSNDPSAMPAVMIPKGTRAIRSRIATISCRRSRLK